MKKILILVLSIFIMVIMGACTSNEYVANSDAEEIPISGGPMAVHFIDVGQGDCTFVDYGDVEILIDGGDYDTWETVEEYIKPIIDDKLDYVIATHPDADHVGGLTYILNDFSIGTIIDSGAYKNTDTYKNYISAVGASDAKVIYDNDLTFDLGGGAFLKIIETGDGHEDVNDDSVVSRIEYGKFSFMTAGDMGASVEKDCLSKFNKTLVLKAAHHGSSYSTSMDFLNVLKPKYVIISAGEDNSYGHPHKETLERINASGGQAMSTIDYGNIIVETDGTSISIYGK